MSSEYKPKLDSGYSYYVLSLLLLVYIFNFLDRQITPKLKLWSTPENSTDVFVYDALTRIQDADTAKNTVEVPFRFYPCLTAGLAYYLAMKRAPDRIQLLKAMYEEEFERASAEDRDRSNLSLTPSSTYYGFV